jgi:hypothetical protein
VADRYRLGVHGGHRAGRVVLVIALLALPLVGLTVLASAGASALLDPSRDAVLRLAPGQGGEAQVVRSGSEAENGARRGPAFLAAVLVTTGAAIALMRFGRAPEVRPARVHRGLPIGPTSRAPPPRSSR